MPLHGKTASRSIDAFDLIPPERRSQRPPHADGARALIVEDAVFEVLPLRSTSLRQTNDNATQTQAVWRKDEQSAAPGLAGTLASRLERQLARLSPQAFVVLISALSIAMFWACGGFSHFGARASVQPAADFVVSDVAVATEDANGMKVVAVFGKVVNASGVSLPAPVLTVRNGVAQEPLGRITLPVGRIEAGATMAFSGRFNLAGVKSGDIVIIPDRP